MSNGDPKGPEEEPLEAVAVIGLDGRFPGARSPDELWRLLHRGEEAITRFTREQMLAAGVDPDLLDDPDHVPAGAVLDGIEDFDADFFRISAREAERLDPQHRIFLECAWHSLEDAGHDPHRFDGRIGVFAGSNQSAYLLEHLLPGGSQRITDQVELLLGTDRDYLATRVSYKLGLDGPSLSVSTACSTSLVAVVLACQNLLAYHCDMALAGGVSVHLPQEAGYLHRTDAGTLSPDGHCRAFDADAAGTVFGNGAGVVVLRRLSDALADGDHIRAVIKGWAVNNDGSAKAGFMAPGVEGHAEVVAEALEMAGFSGRDLSYLEAHGTGTRLGDPIEIEALTRALRRDTDDRGFCAIGSVKTNLGHLVAAAGAASLIKTVLALEHQTLPASLHYRRPNPRMDLAASPFFVNAERRPWPRSGTPRRAGVSSLGLGGTNAHVALEEAPRPGPPSPSRDWQLLPLSARTPTALEEARQRLAAHLAGSASGSQAPALADIAHTLQVGRRAFGHRSLVVARNHDEAAETWRDGGRGLLSASPGTTARPVAFLVAGAGTAPDGLDHRLYEREPRFRAAVDEASAIATPLIGIDPRRLLFPADGDRDEARSHLRRPAAGLSSLFVLQHALAQTWIDWGLEPDVLLGHSSGEILVAQLAGVFSLEDALRLVAFRGDLLAKLPPGAMLTVGLPADELRPRLPPELAIAAINAPEVCLVSGPPEPIEPLRRELDAEGILALPSPLAAAGHSRQTEPLVPEIEAFVAGLDLHPPRRPYVSTVTGRRIRPEEATDPAFWGRHTRGTVLFADAIDTLADGRDRLLLEIGPGRDLASLARRHPAIGKRQLLLSSLPPARSKTPSWKHLLTTLGRLWLGGAEVDWAAFSAPETRRRVPLPTYPFQRRRYWIDPPAPGDRSIHRPGRKADLGDWFYLPAWRQALAPRAAESPATWLLLGDGSDFDRALAARLEGDGARVVRVEPGATFEALGPDHYRIAPAAGNDYLALGAALAEELPRPPRIVHTWLLGDRPHGPALERGFFSLLWLLRAMARAWPEKGGRVILVADGLFSLPGDPPPDPEKVPVLGPARVVDRELAELHCRVVDLPAAGPEPHEVLVEKVLAEARTDDETREVAYRGRARRFLPSFDPIHLPRPEATEQRLRPRGVYLLTGGFGRLGLALGQHLAATVRARLVLVGRSIPGAEDPRRSHLAALEAAGSEVLVVAADLGDLDQVRDLARQIDERFGELHGLFHLAADLAPETFFTLADADEAHCRQVFRPKILGTRHLDRVFGGGSLDFVCLASSLASVLGGLGNSAYVAANLFVDAFARNRAEGSDIPWISIAWDAWGAEGEAPAGDPRYTEALEAILAPVKMSTTQGIEVFDRALGAAFPHLLVSTADLEARLAERDRSRLETVEGAQETKTRPALQNPLVEPRDGLERRLCEQWAEMLGYDRVGIYDNFFELGGDSLLAIRLMPKMRETLGAEIPLRRLVEEPTIAGVVAAVEEMAREDDPSLAPRLLTRLRTPRGEVRRTLVCVPYAGGNAIIYQGLAAALPEGFAVYSVDPPGHDPARPDEEKSPLERLATDAFEEIRDRVEGPLYLYGHCGGSLSAIEIARRLETEGVRVEKVFVGAVTPVSRDELHELPSARKLRRYSDRRLKKFLLDLGGIDPSIPAEQLQFVLDGFRHDAVTSREYYDRLYGERQPPPITAPIINIVGDSDPLVPEYETRFERWQQFAATVRLEVIAGGGHYFVREQAAEVAAIIDRETRLPIARPAPPPAPALAADAPSPLPHEPPNA